MITLEYLNTNVIYAKFKCGFSFIVSRPKTRTNLKKLLNISVVDSNKITKYFRNQKPYTGNTLFTDPIFKPDDFSIFGNDGKGGFRSFDQKFKGITWSRATEILGEKIAVFQNKIEINDIKQGSLGNCYLMSSIASIVQFPELVTRIFRIKMASDIGYYEVGYFII